MLLNDMGIACLPFRLLASLMLLMSRQQKATNLSILQVPYLQAPPSEAYICIPNDIDESVGIRHSVQRPDTNDKRKHDKLNAAPSDVTRRDAGQQ